MKNLHLFGIVILLGLSFFMLSCSDDDGPTAPDTPNFEDFSPYMWDYNSVLWFELDYLDIKSGIATVDVSLTAKGEDGTAALKVNDQDVVFADVTSYTNGKLYTDGAFASGPIQISTAQPVTYKITYNDDIIYTGQMALPDEVTGNFPNFVPTNNFAPNWVMGDGNTAPNFVLVEAMAAKEDGEFNWTSLNYIRQIEGTETNDLLLSSFWQPLNPLDYFSYDISPIVYELKSGKKLLTVGISNDHYEWSSIGKMSPVQSKSRYGKVMEAIDKDINK